MQGLHLDRNYESYVGNNASESRSPTHSFVPTEHLLFDGGKPWKNGKIRWSWLATEH